MRTKDNRKRVNKRILDDAFWSYVDSAKRLPQVLAILGSNGETLSVTTIIRERNVRVCEALFEMEQESFARFSGLPLSFDVLYGQRRRLDELISKPRSYPWSWIRHADKKTASLAR